MSWFKKEERVKYQDDEGNPLPVPERTVVHKPRFDLSKKESKTPKWDAAMEEYYEKHPNEKSGAKLKSGAVKLGRKLDDWSKNYNKKQKKRGNPPIIIMGGGPSSSSSGGRPPLAMDMFNIGRSNRPPSRNPSKNKPSGNKKYVIQGGVAYPIARKSGGGSKKKKSKKPGGKKRGNGPFDFPGIGW